MAGGIGSGKTTVAAILSELGAVVIDSDAIARAQYADPQVVSTLRQWWGDSICQPDGTVNRAKIADLVFRDPHERARLAGIIHPRVAERRHQLMAAYQRDPSVAAIVIDSPLLFETGLDRLCDLVVFVHADAQIREARVRDSRGWSREEWSRREKLQKPLDIKRQQADYIVVSNSGLHDLRSQVERLFSRVLHENGILHEKDRTR